MGDRADHFFVRDGFRFDQPSPAVERIRQLLESGHGIMIYPEFPKTPDESKSETVIAWGKYPGDDDEMIEFFGMNEYGWQDVIEHQSIKKLGVIQEHEDGRKTDTGESRIIMQVLGDGHTVYLAPELQNGNGDFFSYRLICFKDADH